MAAKKPDCSDDKLAELHFLDDIAALPHPSESEALSTQHLQAVDRQSLPFFH